ncbi:carotenoid biosynthesis protein [Methanofollis tationis]|uniref:Carotenoid biosynthesis protein n=1 Tax=Methanofollis tationis TaxID=81417 RepID=A0A7K4HPH0_9EURY|nr:carotenoid biosynthesis protein [Methanofollis tationis]NVO67151.1 carotenoid biosynthesis protein [Methanofollis tationis]
MRWGWRVPAGVGAVAAGSVGFALVDFGDAPQVAAPLFLVLMALPAYAALVRWIGARRGVLVLLVLSVLPLLVEALAVLTGVPYGGFSYSEALGPKALGLVPWTVALAYPPVFLGCAAAASALFGTSAGRFILATSLCAVLADLVLDPAAVRAGFWIWDSSGVYYGIPAVNFAGWALTGLVYAAVLRWCVHDRFEEGEGVPGTVAVSAVVIFGFWAGYLLREGLFVPAALGIALAALFLALPERGGGLGQNR